MVGSPVVQQNSEHDDEKNQPGALGELIGGSQSARNPFIEPEWVDEIAVAAVLPNTSSNTEAVCAVKVPGRADQLKGHASVVADEY